MNCDSCREYLPEYRDGSLPAETAAAVRGHLATCADCQRQERQEAALLAAAAALPRHAPATATLLHLGAQLRAIVAPPPRRTEFGPVLDLVELADYLRVEPAVLGPYADQIPHFELGGQLRFRRVTVDRWLAAREQFGGQAAVDDDPFGAATAHALPVPPPPRARSRRREPKYWL